MTLPDWELWACALAMDRQHGPDAPALIAERIGALALAADADGVAAWQAIATKLAALLTDDTPPH